MNRGLPLNLSNHLIECSLTLNADALWVECAAVDIDKLKQLLLIAGLQIKNLCLTQWAGTIIEKGQRQ